MEFRVRKRSNFKVAFFTILFSTLVFMTVLVSVASNVEKEIKIVSNTVENTEMQAYFKEKEKTLPTFTKVASAEIEKPELQNILIVGSDSRTESFVGRSDVLLVAQINPTTQRIKLLSIPRDTRVEIMPKGYYDKINHAFAKGIDTSVQTIENFLDIQLDGYVQFNFLSFMEIVDTLGGVEVDSKLSFTEQNSKGVANAISISKGRQVLTGEQALAYARMRKQDLEGDMGRGKRQQEIVQSLTTKILNPINLSKSIELLPILAKYTVSSYTPYQFADYASKYAPIDWSFETKQIEGQGAMIGGVYYYQPNDSSVRGSKQFLQVDYTGEITEGLEVEPLPENHLAN